MALANQEGGAHVDPMRFEHVRQLEEGNSMGWTYRDPMVAPEGVAMLNGPLAPAVRQIAYEVQCTIEQNVTLIHQAITDP